MPQHSFRSSLSVVLRVEGFEPRSSPALIWTGWDALDPITTGDDSYTPTSSTALVSGTDPSEGQLAPDASQDTLRSPSTSLGAVKPTGQPTGPSLLGPEPGFTGGTPYSLDEEVGYDPNIGVGGDGGGQGQAPVIVNFACAGTSGGVWTFSGQVLDDTPGGLSVRLGGAPATLQNQSATTDSNGFFSKSFVLQTNGSDTGTATADTTDRDGNASNTAQCNVNP
jgi:hypothetical protein